MATRAGRKWRYDPCTDKIEGGDLAPFLSILCNNVQIYGAATEDEPPQFIIKTLVERGAVAYVREWNAWAAFVPVGRKRRTGLPRAVRLVGDDGTISEPFEAGEGKEASVCIIPANAYSFPPKKIIRDKVETLFAVSTALGQNLDAIKQASAIIYDDADLKAQIEAAERERLRGASTVKIQKTAAQTVKIENFSPNAKSFIPDLLAVWVNTIEELDESTGRVRVGEKTERRTDDEIAVIENSACSTIDTIIDTFNRFAAWYGIEAHAVRGTETRRVTREGADEEDADGEANNEESAREEREGGADD